MREKTDSVDQTVATVPFVSSDRRGETDSADQTVLR